MRIRTCLLPAAALIVALAVLAPVALGGLTGGGISVSPARFNLFLVADLGIGGSGGTSVFYLDFAGGSGTDPHYLEMEIRDESFVTLAEGTTGSTNYARIPSRVGNKDINRIFGSGDFEVGESGKRYKDVILATGALPKSSVYIDVTLKDAEGVDFGSTTLGPITIDPAYLQPIYPVDVSSTRDTLAFRWITNIDANGPVELHIYTDPRGNDEVRSGGRLPFRGITGDGIDGAAVAPILEDGMTYYWQVHGEIVTSHGNERVKGPLSRFVYFEEASSVLYLGLSDADKSRIKDELIEILKELVNKRAAKSIGDYELDRIVFDGGVVTRDEIMRILALIREKQVTVNSIYFR